jgi:outer membrane receptor protein involved in Fe transport
MMKKTLLTVSLILFAFFTLISAQDKGIVSGKIIDKSNGEGLPGAAIRVEGTTIGTVSDIEGNFQFSLAAGSHTLEISFISYQTGKIKVDVKSKETTNVSFTMEEAAGLELAAVIVTATVEKSTTTAMMIERKKAAQVSDGISADLIRKTPDRTTSDVLKRITGASIQDGKFAIIRGMNDRYNTGYLDGALLPSTESDRKAFAFDVVPANLLDNLVIIKSGTPDLVGDFGGGVIKINTKSIPERFTQNLNIGAQYNSITTFKDFTQYKTYGGEQFNIFGNERNLPALGDNDLRSQTAFPSSAEKTKLANASQGFNHDWGRTTSSAMPNMRFAYSMGMPINLKNGSKIGLILALNYSNTKRYSDVEVNSYDGDGPTAAYNDKAFLQNTSSGGILNLNYVSAKTQINFRNLLNLNTDNNTTLRTGIGNFNDNLKVQNSANNINYNRLYNGIVSLKQIIGERALLINASASYSDVRRKIPDYRIANYFSLPGEPFQLTTGDFFNSSTGRFSSDLTENLKSGTLELSKEFNASNIKTEVKVGGFIQSRNRSFYGRSFVYNGNLADAAIDPSVDLSLKNIGSSKLYLIEKTSNDLAYYDGKSDLKAYFLSIDQKFSEKLRAVYGVRYEDMDIKVTNPRVNSNVSAIKDGVWLPSINLTYSLNEKMNLRADYFASVNRPEFRELAPFSFYTFDKNAEIRGNNSLQVAKLNNFDLRYEYYPSGGQLISLGGFYKSIDKPIEFNVDIGQPTLIFYYGNEKSAKIYGLEFEIKKSFDFLGSSKFAKNTSIFANLSLIKSALDFTQGSSAIADRPLQGQSPYIVNMGIQYEDQESGWFGSAVMNRTGRRVAYVGADKKFFINRQDIYEAPRAVVDVQFGKNFKNFNIKLTLGDILHNDLIFYQDYNNDGVYTKDTGKDADLLMFKFNNGFTTNLSVSYNF